MRKMKDSGIDWIGMIPENWSCGKQKYVLQLLNGRAYAENEFEGEGKYKVLRVGNLFTNPVWYYSNLELEPNKYCEKGDLLYSWSMSYAPIIWDGEKVIYHYHIWKVLPSEKLDKKFAYYYLLSLTDALQAEIHETTMGFITMGVMNNSCIAYPSLSEQKKIAVFLDGKCADIDQIRADIEKQIEILTDYKKSVITEAVTKGLDPKVKMKDSGIEWIGEIPEHWDVHPLYYYFGERKHKNVLGEEKNLLSISYGKIIRKNIDSKEGLLPENFNGYNIIEKDDIVMRLTDLQNDKRSLRTGLVKEHGIITSAYVTLKAKRDLSAVYFHYLLHCYDLLKVLYNMGNGVRQGLNFSELSRMMLIEPSIVEQKAIASYLDEKCSEIDATIAEKQKQLETLEEYKKSLIFEYVTGKKEVSA